MTGFARRLEARAMVSELRLRADSSRLRTARRHVESAAARVGLDSASSSQFVYAVNEAVTNAIRHGAPDAQGLIKLRTVIEDERLTVHVHDSGDFVAPTVPPGPRADHGRGFMLMARFSDEVRLNVRPGATTVTLSVERPA
jgi:anti-sigma regulatory factor (Ser/Thr protein kinase)